MFPNRLPRLRLWTLLPLLATAATAVAQPAPEEIEALLERYHAYGLFNGSALVARDGEILFEGGFGAADMAWDVPNAPDTRFRIASTTKPFTAALILTLVEEGKLDLDAPVTDYLPDYPADQGDRVTIHHLLTHTSGIPSYTTPAFMEDAVRDPHPPDSLLALFSDLELEFEPGDRWAYSNSGYILLGAIVEAVTGKPYDQALRERVLDPLGLEDTGYAHHDEVIERLAAGYVRGVDGWRRAPYLDTSVPYSAGMLYSTVRDLHAWSEALLGRGPFRSDSTAALLVAPHVALPPALPEQFHLPPAYGYGWFVGDVPVGADTVRVLEHGGGIFGFSTAFMRLPEERGAIVVLDNASSGKIREIARGLLLLLHGEEVPLPRRPIAGVLHDVVEAEGVAAAVARYERLAATAPDRYDFAESELNRLGYHYLREARPETAIEFFRLNAEAYPESANVWDSLGEAYLEAGDRERAIASYRRALDRNPDFENARRMLERIEAEAP